MWQVTIYTCLHNRLKSSILIFFRLSKIDKTPLGEQTIPDLKIQLVNFLLHIRYISLKYKYPL